MNKIVGIIGGLGPETTSEFYLYLINKFRKTHDYYPSILIDNVSFQFELEKEIIVESKNEEILVPNILESIDRLNKAGVDFVVMPCNTMHIFIENFRDRSKVPFLSIIDETAKMIKNRGFREIGLLATTKTVESGMYEDVLRKENLNIILPTKKEQDKISNIEIKILRNNVSAKDTTEMRNIIRKLIRRGSEAIILGCIDFQLVIDQKSIEIEIFDSMKILAEATYEYLVCNIK